MKIAMVALMFAMTSASLSFVYAGNILCEGLPGIQAGKERHETPSGEIVHHAIAVVHAVNRENGTVSVKHEPVPSLNWPAMTKTFVVENRAQFDRLVVGRQVCIEFERRQSGYIITSVR